MKLLIIKEQKLELERLHSIHCDEQVRDRIKGLRTAGDCIDAGSSWYGLQAFAEAN